MPRGRPLAALTLSPSEREQLMAITRSRSHAACPGDSGSADPAGRWGGSNTAIAEELGLSRPTVGTWRQRYLAPGQHTRPRVLGTQFMRHRGWFR